MTTILYILLAIVLLLFMVLVHELGHYIAGKALKFKITEFSVGFGKAIISHTSKKTGEKFSLRLFPLGGYCAFYGEDDGKEDAEGAFNSQAPWKRIIVFLAGVTMNFITAIVFSWILLCTTGYDVMQIVAYSDTYNVGVFQVGDIITHVGGEKVDFAFGGTTSSLITAESKKAIEFYQADDYDENEDGLYTSTITVRRNEKSFVLEINYYPYTYTKTVDGVEKTYFTAVMGLESDILGAEQGVESVASLSAYRYGLLEGFLRSIPMAFGFAWVVLKSLWMLITFQLKISEIGGTVSTIWTMATYAQSNIANVLIFIPLISANLAVFNILPIPALDGSHVVFTTIEWIRGKPINREIEGNIHFVGLIILLAFVVIVDVLHFVL